MGLNQSNNKIEYDFICNKCYNHYIIELVASQEDIFIRKYCYCIESTIPLLQILQTNFFGLILKSDFFINHSCDNELWTKGGIKMGTIYCYECNKFFCDFCIKKHNHSNIINKNFLLTNCRNHTNEKIIGFCSDCKKLICWKCIFFFL